MLLHQRSVLMNFVRISRATAVGWVGALILACGAPGQFAFGQSSTGGSKLRFEISFPASLSSKPLDGHVMLGIAKDEKPEPRYQLREEEAESAQFFGLDVDALAPGTSATIDSSPLGYPLVNLYALPAGDYYVQAVL